MNGAEPTLPSTPEARLETIDSIAWFPDTRSPQGFIGHLCPAAFEATSTKAK